MLLLALLIVLATALLLNAIVQFRSLIAQLLSIYIFSFSDIAFTLHIASLLNVMNREWLVLLIAALILLAVITLWKLTKSKSPFFIITEIIKIIKNTNYRNLIKKYSYIPILAAFLVIGYLFIAVLIYVVPPNNVDSVSTHMSRVIYWLQHGNYFPWNTPRGWQIIYPVNAQLQSFWSVLFTNSDHFVGFGQFFAALFSSLAIAGIGRTNGFSKKKSLFPALVFLTLPAVVLQSSTTQNDLAITALFIISIYFFFYGIKEQKLASFSLSGVCIGLAVGTKQTMLFLLVPYVILYLLAWLVFKKVNFKQLFHLGWVSILAFLLIGSQIFFSNYINFGHPLGSPETVKSQSLSIMRSSKAAEITLINASRFTYQMADLSGLPDPLWGYGIKLKALIMRPIYKALHIDIESPVGTYPGYDFLLLERTEMQEDFAWYGPLGFIILIPLSIYAIIAGIRKKNLYMISSAIFFYLFLILIVFFRSGWDPYQGRYFMPVVAMLTPLIGTMHNDKLASKITIWLFSAIAISTLVSSIFLNTGKPITGGRNVWNLDRIGLLNLQNTYLLESMEAVDSKLPLNTTVGLASSRNYFIEYPFFGKDFSRDIIPLYPVEHISDQTFYEENDIEYVIYYSTDQTLEDVSFLKLIVDSERIQLYKVEINSIN